MVKINCIADDGVMAEAEARGGDNVMRTAGSNDIDGAIGQGGGRAMPGARP